jgi:hypothetical protein
MQPQTSLQFSIGMDPFVSAVMAVSRNDAYADVDDDAC